MEQTGVAWILSRITARIERRPHYGDKLTVQTWPRGAEKLFAVRDCAILDEAGEILARARSNWLIVDLEKRRPLRPQLTMGRFPLNEGLDMVNERVISLEPREGLVKTGERRALYSDIDYYGHVNNARYAQWIQDSVEPGLLEQAETLRLDIVYLQEIKLGETIELWQLPLTPMPVSEARPAEPTSDVPAPADSALAVAFEGRRNVSDTTGLKQEAVFRAMPVSEARPAEPTCDAPAPADSASGVSPPAFAFEGRRNVSDTTGLKQEAVFRAELYLSRSEGVAD
jgi:acyl-CoA thioesterase FadM